MCPGSAAQREAVRSRAGAAKNAGVRDTIPGYYPNTATFCRLAMIGRPLAFHSVIAWLE
jgi:hypothetical protein